MNPQKVQIQSADTMSALFCLLRPKCIIFCGKLNKGLKKAQVR